MKLSPRQKQIAELIADGKDRETIAAELGITAGRVSNQITQILKRKRLKSTLELCAHIWSRRYNKVVNPQTTETLNPLP